MRYIIFGGSFDPSNERVSARLGECEQTIDAATVICDHPQWDWYLLYDRATRDVVCHHVQENVTSTHRYPLSPEFED